ncbi:hypothetical protein HII28_00435 [Planctomonas sp. JC2975]|uniref:hypothetical protein n=1 Tax=Planctomonas sp. JC2975 TaxID=2729626 RepID=UPI0014746566|nr:hypothetical protein [Planctomonas sp. JC2975]NNC10352.1 hypothetical protein [Planctomonas sp. JC2975]
MTPAPEEQEERGLEHGAGWHIVDPESDCARCRAGELPTVYELARALMFERSRHVTGDYRKRLREWLNTEANAELVWAGERV